MTMTPAEIRDLLYEDPSQVSDAQLLALIVGQAVRPRILGQQARVWSCFELGEELYRAGGGRLPDFVISVLAGSLDLESFGLAKTLGTRLLAAVELAERWRCGFRPAGSAEIRPASGDLRVDLDPRRLPRGADASEAELLVSLLGESLRRHPTTDALLSAFKDPGELMVSFRLGLFKPAHGLDRTYMVLEEADLRLDFISLGRLAAAIELADRYCGARSVKPRDLEAGPSGLSRRDLASLLQPGRRWDRRLREILTRLLRTHPDLSEELADLDTLAADAGVESYEEALELHGEFEELCERKRWSDPAEVLGRPVPFARLLSIADAEISRAEDPPRRLQRVRKLLLDAERQASREPVIAFVDHLLDLMITNEEAADAFEAARRRYYERR